MKRRTVRITKKMGGGKGSKYRVLVGKRVVSRHRLKSNALKSFSSQWKKGKKMGYNPK